jgi:hypothetical protein
MIARALGSSARVLCGSVQTIPPNAQINVIKDLFMTASAFLFGNKKKTRSFFILKSSSTRLYEKGEKLTNIIK